MNYNNYTYRDLIILFNNYIYEIYNMSDDDILISLMDESSRQRELLRGFLLLMQNLGFEGSKESEK